MTVRRPLRFAALALVLLGASASPATSQVLGPFRWQMAPFCNVLTLEIEQQGAMGLLTGADDGCGAPVAGATSGRALQSPTGAVTFTLTTMRPDGIAVATSATVDVTTGAGTWSDEFGNSGTLVFSPAAPPTGAPRGVTLSGVWGMLLNATAAGQLDAQAMSFGRTLSASPAFVPANVIPPTGPATANCPGSYDEPRAAPGQLCLYEGQRLNVNLVTVSSAKFTTLDSTDRNGAAVGIRATAAGVAISSGKWAVGVP